MIWNMISWKMIAAPVVGALIGYLTNWIAVKMLFHPRYEIRIWGRKLPFTPGVIPKGQPRLARGIGNVVKNQLLTTEVMRGILLSDKMKNQLADAVRKWISEQKASRVTLKDTALTLTDEDSLHEMVLFARESGAEYLMDRVEEMDLAHIVVEKIVVIAQEKLSESMFGMMIGGGFLNSIGEMVEKKLREYIQENGQDYLERLIAQEISSLGEKTVGESISLLDDHGINLACLTTQVYEMLIDTYLGKVIEALDFSKIVEDRINSMKVEELVLSIMKKELGTIVNLGAVIGFILGLIEVLIMVV